MLSADSRKASCQLLVKEWTLNTGKLPAGGLRIKWFNGRLSVCHDQMKHPAIGIKTDDHNFHKMQASGMLAEEYSVVRRTDHPDMTPAV